MGRLQRRVDALEKKAGVNDQKVHVISWRCYEETKDEAMDRFLARNPGLEIRSTDLCVFIKKFGPPPKEALQ